MLVLGRVHFWYIFGHHCLPGLFGFEICWTFCLENFSGVAGVVILRLSNLYLAIGPNIRHFLLLNDFTSKHLQQHYLYLTKSIPHIFC